MRIVALLAIAAGLSLGQISPPPTNAPSGAAGGNLSGTYPNPTVAKINGTTVAVNSAANQVALTTAAAVTTWTGIPNCLDSVGQHLNYNTTTHVFSCGTSGTGGAPGSPVSSLQYNNAGALGGLANIQFDQKTAFIRPVFIGTGLNDCQLLAAFPGGYTGSQPASFNWQIDSVGTPDTIEWRKNGGSYTTGVPIPDGAAIALPDGARIGCITSTGHTLGDSWVGGMSTGGLLSVESEAPADGPTAALAGTGAGVVTVGSHSFDVTFATPEGETWPSYSPATVAVTDNSVNGKILISNFPAFTDSRITGWYLHVSDIDGGDHMAAFIPANATTFVFNKSDAQLGTDQPEFNNINSTGPCLYALDGPGVYSNWCAFQVTAEGIALRQSSQFFLHDYQSGFLSTGSTNGAYFMGSNQPHGTMAQQVQMSDGTGTTGQIASYAADGSLTPVASLGTSTNCSSATSPAVCASAAAGSVAIPTGTNPTLVVNTTKVTANSQILLQSDDSLGTKLSVTCNSTLASVAAGIVVTARTAGTSFTITFNGVLATNPLCLSYTIIN